MMNNWRKHRGQPGVHDEGLLDSALDRPTNQYPCGKPDIIDLAAACAYDLFRNHPFLDGNRRASCVACETFLNLNGIDLIASDEEALMIWISLGEGGTTEAELAQWLRGNSGKDEGLTAHCERQRGPPRQ